MTTQTGRAFNEWLRAQLKAKKMSQRQLAQQSGVDHSTISRLIRGDRMPSLGTATALARGLREIREDADTAQYLGVVTNGAQNPTARIEYALRSDDVLGEAQVRQIMEYYLAVRTRRFGRVFQPVEGNGGGSSGRSLTGDPASTGSSAAGPAVEETGSGLSRDTHQGPPPQRSQAPGQSRFESLPVGSRPLGYAHLPSRASGTGQPGRVQPRVSGTSTLTRPPGRTSDRS